MSKYQLSGKIKAIMDLQSFTSGFSKREFVVTTEDRYPQDIKLELHKERTSLLDNITINDVVTVDFDIRGNEYQGKHYVSLVAWKIDNQASSSSADATENDNDFDTSDDVPFKLKSFSTSLKFSC